MARVESVGTCKGILQSSWKVDKDTKWWWREGKGRPRVSPGLSSNRIPPSSTPRACARSPASRPASRALFPDAVCVVQSARLESAILLPRLRLAQVRGGQSLRARAQGGPGLTCLHRLAEHHSRKHISRSALALVQAKALSLLSPPAASPVLGVREESELKALKFSLATRLRDVRLAAANAREVMVNG